jgi:hypothetical protein
MIDFRDVKARLAARRGQALSAGVDADIAALVAEVERLHAHRESCTENLLKGYETGKAEERAAVVAWLREVADEWSSGMLDDVSGFIERGEHRREEKK